MNHSTEGVTLYAAFINDVLSEVKKIGKEDKALLDMVTDQDLSDPFNEVPMQIYNDMCQWVENNLGEETLYGIGVSVGETAYGSLVENHIVEADAEPNEIMEGLVIAASSMIQDPEDRGWEIVDYTNESIHIRKTQTFNAKLQNGLLQGLIAKSPKTANVQVDFFKKVSEGAEFDEYNITWEEA